MLKVEFHVKSFFSFSINSLISSALIVDSKSLHEFDFLISSALM